MNNAPNAYRPEIDGLRALAILPVVFYHAGLGFPGGFVGVDVFFVISGFLIGGIILRELEAGDFVFRRFWTRRIRRIVPAILVFLAVTLLVGWRILPPPNFSALASQTLSALFALANFKMLALTGGYWASPANSVLLLHTWSLAVEEQFYFVMPVLLVCAHRWFRRHVVTLMVVLLAASLALSLYQGTAVNPANFFLLPSRAWELLLGCLGAWALKDGLSLPRSLVPWTAAAGIIGIVLSSLLFQMGPTWPDARTLLPALATFLILISPAPTNTVSLPVRFLSLPPLRFFGLISYSLYLWHWPMIVFFRDFGPDTVTLADRWLLVLAAVAVATLSWRFVEQPTRNQLPSFRVATRPLLLSVAAIWLCLLAVSAEIAKTPIRQLASLSSMPAFLNSPGGESIQKYDAVDAIQSGGIQFNASNATPKIVLLGSSHGMALGPVVESLSDAYHLPCAVLSRGSAISPLFSGNMISNRVPRKLREHRRQDEAVQKYISLWRPRLVIVAARWNDEFDDRISTPPPSPESYVMEASNTLAWLGQHATRVVVFGQVPQLPFQNGEDARSVIWRRYRNQGDVMPRLLEHPAVTAKRRHAFAILQSCAPTNVFVLDPDPIFHKPDQSLRYFNTNGLLYFDMHHLNSLGSLELKPLLEPYFQSAAQ